MPRTRLCFNRVRTFIQAIPEATTSKQAVTVSSVLMLLPPLVQGAVDGSKECLGESLLAGRVGLALGFPREP